MGLADESLLPGRLRFSDTLWFFFALFPGPEKDCIRSSNEVRSTRALRWGMGRVSGAIHKSSWVAGRLAASLASFAVSFAGGAPLAPARAADLPVGPSYYPAKPFPPPAIYDWTGIYVGGNVGGGMLVDFV